MSDTPESDRLAIVTEDSQAISDFLDTMREQHGIVLGHVDDKGDFAPLYLPTQHVIAVYHGIDLVAVEREQLEYAAALGRLA